MQTRNYKFFGTIVLVFFILLVVSCQDAEESPYPAVQFQSKTTPTAVGRSSAVGFAIGDKGYVTLGRSGKNGGALVDCWEYNPSTDSWTQKMDFKGAARVNAIAEVINNQAYVGLGVQVGGSAYNSNVLLNDFWCFDPVANTWTQKADYPDKAPNNCISFVANAKIYAGFGFDGWNFTNRLWCYDPVQNTWKQMGETPLHKRFGAVACTDGEKVFIGTGFDTASKNDWWEYVPATDTWKQRCSLPYPGRENSVALAIGNRFFVSTGRYFHGPLTGGRLFSDLLEYDAVRNQWYVRGEIPERENAIAFTIAGKGYIGFGENDSTVLNDLWSFEP